MKEDNGGNGDRAQPVNIGPIRRFFSAGIEFEDRPAAR